MEGEERTIRGYWSDLETLINLVRMFWLRKKVSLVCGGLELTINISNIYR